MSEPRPFAQTAHALLLSYKKSLDDYRQALKSQSNTPPKAPKGKDVSLFQRGMFWVAHLGDKDWNAITPEDLESGLAKLMTAGRQVVCKGRKVEHTDEPIAPATLNKYLIAYASMTKMAKERYLLPRTHVSASRFVTKQPENNGRYLDITKEEIEDLIKVAHLARWKPLAAIIAVAATSGLRKGNLQQLRWRDVDLEKCTVTVAMTKNGLPHTSAISPLAVKELCALKRSHYGPNDLIFGAHHFDRAFQRAVQDAGLESKVTCFHLLRHACASLLAKSGAQDSAIMAVMGHKTPSMTRRYAHLRSETLIAAVANAWS